MKKALWLVAFVMMLALGVAACGSSADEQPVTTAVSTASTLPSTTEAAADVVTFKDPVLEKGIRAALNKPTGDITFVEAATLKELHLDIPWQSPEEMMIKDLSGLEHVVNLESLDIQFHAITDISPIAGLTQLRGLSLGGNQIADISPLAGLTNLSSLSLFNCQATDYSPLKNLVLLNTLFMEYSTFADASVLAGLKDLETLQLQDTKITDVSPLASLTKLRKLTLASTAVTDFSPLKDIYPNLAEKDFEMVTGEVAAGVVTLNDPVLEKGIRAALNKPTGDITFAEATTLKELRLDIPWQSPEEMMIKDLTGLERFVNLEILEMQFHAIKDITPLAGLVRIKGLALGGNQIADITPLAGMTKLDFLCIFNCQATDYSTLKNFTSLRVLYISWSTIADLSVLSGLTGLEDIKLDNCSQVSNVTPLAGLPKLKKLALTATAVTDFSPLKAIYPNLTEKDFDLN
jgi:internalin A